MLAFDLYSRYVQDTTCYATLQFLVVSIACVWIQHSVAHTEEVL